MRRAQELDAAVILERRAGDRPIALGASGLSALELERVLSSACGSGARRRFAVPGFAAVAFEEAPWCDASAVGACGLKREAGRISNPALVGAFARHAAVAVASAREPRPRPTAIQRDGATRLALRLLDGPNCEELSAAVAAEMALAIGPAKVWIHVWDEQLAVLRAQSAPFGTGRRAGTSIWTHDTDLQSSIGRVFAIGRPYLTNDTSADPRVAPDDVTGTGLRQQLLVPLDAGHRRVGVIQVVDKGADFTIADLHAVEDLAPHIAVALDLTRLREELVRRQSLDEILRDIAIDIAAGKNLQQFLPTALDDLCAATRAAAIVLMPVSGEPIVWRQRDDRPELLAAVVAEAREAAAMRTHVVPGALGSAAIQLPVHVDGERVATLALLRHRAEPFDADERLRLSQLANLMGLAWETERYHHKRAEIARRSERQRIGDELHDHVAQLLFGARLRLDATLETPGLPAAAAESAGCGRSLVVRADEAIRSIITELAEPYREGLDDALAAVVAGVEDEFTRSVQLKIAPAAAAAAATGRLGRQATDVLVKAAREALVNAAKHAGPCQLALRVDLRCGDRLVLAVADDGIGGVRTAADGHGLATLRRAVRRHGGALRVRTAPTGGTTVTVSIPL